MSFRDFEALAVAARRSPLERETVVPQPADEHGRVGVEVVGQLGTLPGETEAALFEEGRQRTVRTVRSARTRFCTSWGDRPRSTVNVSSSW